MTGLLLFLGSSLTEAGRVVVSQLLLGPYRWVSTGFSGLGAGTQGFINMRRRQWGCLLSGWPVLCGGQGLVTVLYSSG